MITKQTKARILSLAVTSAVLLSTIGCGVGSLSVATPPVQPSVALKGVLFGGQQPIVQSAIHLYAAGTNYTVGSGGYTGTNTDLLTTAVSTDINGNFDITKDYHCTAGQQLYLVAVGGYPTGLSNSANANIVEVSALGDCSTLTANSFIEINEVTTVAAAYALSAFMTSYTSAGSSAANSTGLTRAFVNAAKLADSSTGIAGGPALAPNATAPIGQTYALANTLAACVNSGGGVAGDHSVCGNLFSLARSTSGAAATDTLTAILNIAHNPTVNVADLFHLAQSRNPFPSLLTGAPTDWTLAVSYATPGLSHPKSTTVDLEGNVWIANAGNNTLTILTQSGSPATGSPFKGNGLNAPVAVAIDAGGNAWVANQGGTAVSAFNYVGGSLSGSPFGGAGNLSAPVSIAIDTPGNIWVANQGTPGITELRSDGSFLQQVSTGNASPTALAIDPQ